MQPDQAKLLSEALLANIEAESATTKKVLAAVPDGNPGYKPHEKCTAVMDLCWHIVSSEVWFLNSIADGQFVMGESKRPDNIQTSKDAVKWYEENLPPAVARICALGGDALAKVIGFAGIVEMPAVNWILLETNHVIHHHGQLSVYIRPMGGKVPGIYGPSGDEPMKM